MCGAVGAVGIRGAVAAPEEYPWTGAAAGLAALEASNRELYELLTLERRADLMMDQHELSFAIEVDSPEELVGLRPVLDYAAELVREHQGEANFDVVARQLGLVTMREPFDEPPPAELVAFFELEDSAAYSIEILYLLLLARLHDEHALEGNEDIENCMAHFAQFIDAIRNNQEATQREHAIEFDRLWLTIQDVLADPETQAAFNAAEEAARQEELGDMMAALRGPVAQGM